MFGQSSLSGNKPICQFYQMGNCKYGSSCYNLHPGASGAAAANVFGGNSSNALQDNQFTEFVKQVITEMKMWESSGLWQLSCLAPLKEHPPIAEFVDTSPEELRVEAYEAHKANNSAAYQTSFNSKYEYQKQLRDALKNRNPDALEVLKNVYYKITGGAAPASSSTSLFGKSSGSFLGDSSSQSSLFGGAASGSKPVFGGSTNQGTSNLFGVKPQTSIFGAPPVFGASPFGGSNTFKSTFGGGQSSSLFGSSANSEASQNVFNKPQNPGLFGGVSSGSTDIFGSANTSSSNLFGANSNANKTSLFGTNTSTSGSTGVFGTTASSGTSSIFGTNTSTGTNSIFGTNTGTGSNNIFGTNTNVSGSNSIFGSGTNASGSGGIFGATPTTSSSNSIFGSGTNTSGSGGIFGAIPTTSSSNSIFGVNTMVSGSSIFGTSTTSTTTSNSLFNTNTSTSGSSSLFGPNTSTTGSGIFGTNNTGVIAQNQNTSVFGGTGAQQAFGAAPVFGGQNLFNKNQGNSTIFGSGSSNQTVQSSIFGNPPQTKDIQTRLFGGGTTTSNTAFGGGNANQVSNGGMFGNLNVNEQNQVSSSSSMFGNNFGTGVSTADNTNFATDNQNISTGKSIFSENTNGNNSTTVSVGSAPTSIRDIKPPENQNLFGIKPPENQNLFGTSISSSTVSSMATSGTSTATSISDLIYTPMHLLSIEDKTEFEKDVFLRIPMIPPPKELCF